jgi:DNA-binding NarL/FixJ family response regulator
VPEAGIPSGDPIGARGQALGAERSAAKANESLRVLVADASALWRARVRTRVESAGLTVVGEAEAAAEVSVLAADLEPDLALLDFHLPGGGLMASARLVTRHPRLQVVMMAVAISDDQLFAMLRAGANGYVEKDPAFTRLPHTLRDVMAGQVALPRTLMAVVVDEFARRGTRRGGLVRLPGIQRLSRREQEVVAALLAGASTAEIAEQLFVQPSTVRGYVTRALKKLRVEDRAALVRLANRHGTVRRT